jgi:tetratricopeptide (TPR) repeat protein
MVSLLVALLAATVGLPGICLAGQPAATATQTAQADPTVERYRRILASQPTADNHAALAWVLSRYKSENDGALQHANAALKLEPNHYKAHEIASLAWEMKGQDEEVLPHLLAMIEQDRPETEYWIARVGEITLPVAQRQAAVTALQKLAAQTGRPIHRAAARWVFGELLLREGRLDQARQTFDGLGFVKTWRVIGPFDNEANSGFGLASAPEKEIDLAKSYPGRGYRVSWRKLEHFTLSGLCNLSALMYPNDQVLAYAVTFVKAPARTEAVIRMGAEQSVKLWLNDRLVLADDQDKGFAPDQYVVPVALEAGWNKLLLKVCRSGGEWRFAFRLTDPAGNTPGNLTFSADPPTTSGTTTQALPTRGAATREVPVQPARFAYQGGMLAHFSNQVAENRQNESAVYYLGLAQGVAHRLTPATETFEWLVSLNKNCSEYRLRLAMAYWSDEKPDKAFEELKAALALEPKNVLALTLLGRFYQSRDSLELARQTLDAAVAAAPNSTAAQHALQQLYQARGWTHQAFLKAGMLHESHPEVSMLTANYAAMCDRYGFRSQARELWVRAVAQDQANTSARQSLIDLASREDRIDEALKQSEALQQLLPLSNAVRLARVDLLLRRRSYEAAMTLCKESLAICPTQADVQTKLGEILERMGKPAEAVMVWRTALRYKPDDQRLRDYLEFLQPKQENPAFARYGMPAAEADEMIRMTPTDEEAYPKASAVRLLQHRVTQLFEDGSSSSQEHVIVKVLNERGRQEYTRVQLAGHHPKVLRAVVIKPDGTEVEASRVSGQEIHFSQLQPRSFLEYKVVYHTQGTSWLSRHYNHVEAFQSLTPLIRGQWVLLAPPERSVRHLVRGRHVKLTRGEFQGQTVYDFRADNVPMLDPEVAMPPVADIVEQVRLSTIEDWDEIARWEYALIKDEFEPDSAIRQKVGELTAGLTSSQEKMRAVYNFVAQRIQYKVSHMEGIFGVKPPKAANVLANEWGECKGKSALLIAMLRELGVPACYATLRTRDKGRLVRDLPANQCNHAIVYVPDPHDFNRGQWLDATAEYHGLGTLPWADRGIPAMVWKPDGQMVFKEIPQASPSENLIRLVIEADLSANGSAQARTHWSATGEFAAGFRQQFRQVGQRRQQLEALVTNLQAGGQLTDMAFSDLTDRDGPAEIRFDFRADRYAESAGRDMTLRPKRRFDLTSRYAPRTDRQYDLWLPMPSTVEYSEIYRFVPSWTVKTLPSSAELDTPWMTYAIKYTTAPGQLRIDKRLVIKATDVSKSDYEPLRQFCISADEQEQKTVTLERK